MEGSHNDGNYLVRVRAQVMTRDDSTGLWVGAGGLSHVSVCKGSVSSEEDKVEYLIYGKTIPDQTVVLSCTIKKDFQYNKVMPTFHHWQTGDKKFGLTFQTAADAKAFDKGVRMAIEDLSDGIGDFPNFHDSDIGEDDVFMAVELPIDSRSSSGSSSFSGGPFRSSPGLTLQYPDMGSANSPYTPQHLHRMSFVRSARFNPSMANNNIGGYVPDPTSQPRHPRKDEDKMEPEMNSYVQLSRGNEHDYSYPVVDGYVAKKAATAPFTCRPAPPRLPVKAKKKKGEQRLTLARAQCRHCLETYSPEENRRGACEYAPDRVLACIGRASCVQCAQCMLYHCMADSEGDFAATCACDASDRHCPRRWTALALLSLFVPCLWCYLPCRACHRCGVRCGVCGGKHDPA